MLFKLYIIYFTNVDFKAMKNRIPEINIALYVNYTRIKMKINFAKKL